MSTYQLTIGKRTAVAAVAGILTIGMGSAPASARASGTDVPAAGAVVTCDRVGQLTGLSGYLRQREVRWVDGHRRAHVLFTIATRHVELAGPDHTHFRLIGGGYDYVVYPGSDITGAVRHETERFDFDVIGRHGLAGVVRVRLHTGPDQVPHVHDASTCQLPNLS